MFLYIFDKDGVIRKEIRFEVPYTTMIHDIAITPTHVIFPGSSMVTSIERLHEGKKHWGWDRTVPSWYGIVPREGERRGHPLVLRSRTLAGPHRQCLERG